MLKIDLKTSLALSLLIAAGGTFAAEGKRSAGDDSYYTANALYNKGLYELALKQYREFLSKFPNHSERDQSRLGTALCLYSLGRYDEAGTKFKALLASKQIVAKSQLQLLLAQCRLKDGKHAEAEKLFREIAANGPEAYRPKAHAGLIDALYRQKKWEALAAASADSPAKLDESSRIRVAFQSAVSLYNLDRYAEAKPRFAKVVENLDEESPLRRRALFLLAECRRETGESDQALKNYAEIARVKESELKPEALYRMGILYFKANKFRQAEKSLKQFLREHSGHRLLDRAKLYLARSQMELDNPQAAVRTLTPLADAQPAMPEALLWLGNLYLRRQDYAKAAEVLARDHGKVGDESLATDLIYSRASALMGAEIYREAAQLFARISERKPDCRLRQAFCLHYAGEYQRSQELCADFLRDFPQHAEASSISFLNAENLYLLEKTDAALSAYRDFMASDEKHADVDRARLRIADILYQKEDWQGAMKSLDRIRPDGMKGDFFNQYDFLAGDLQFEMGDWKKARERFRKYTSENPEEPNLDLALFKLAVASEEMEDYDQAIEHFRKMAAQCPDSGNLPAALVNLGRLLCRQGKYSEAGDVLQPMTSKHGDHQLRDKAEYYLGWALMRQNNPAAARRHFGYLAANTPGSALAPDALFHLGSIDMEEDKFESAASRFAKLAHLHPDFDLIDQALFQCGVAQIRTKQWQPAAACFKRIPEDFPKSPLKATAIYNHARCMTALGRRDAAIDLYKEILDKHRDSKVLAKASLNLAELSYAREKYDDAIRYIDRALDGVEDKEIQQKMLYRRAWCRFDLEEYKLAAEDFGRLAGGFPQGEFAAEAEFQAGEARFRIGENTAARKHFSAAVQKAGERGDIGELALLRLGETQALTKQWPQSRQTYETFIGRFGKSEWIHRVRLGLGWALENSKLFDEAIRAYRRVVEAGGQTETAARAQFQIGECEFAGRNYENAIREFVKVEVKYRSEKWGSKASLELGRVFESQGDIENAGDQYRETIEKYADEEAAAAAESRLQSLEK